MKIGTTFFCQRSGESIVVKTNEIQQNRNVEDIKQHRFSVAPMMEYTGKRKCLHFTAEM